MKFVSRLLVAGLLSSVALAPAQAEVVKTTLLGVGDVYNFNGGKARGCKLIANDVMVLLKKLGTVDAKVEGRVLIQ